MEKKVLLVEDSYYYRAQLSMLLSNAGYVVLLADSSRDALAIVETEQPDVAVLDAGMPSINGFELCRLLRENPENDSMAIVILSPRDNEEDRLGSFEIGADDFIVKPLSDREFVMRIGALLRLINRRHPVNALSGMPGNLDIQREINSRIAHARLFAAVYVDLCELGGYNTVYGFEQGNRVITLLADILREETARLGNPGDFIGHINGGDFVVLTTPDRAYVICEHCIARFDQEVLAFFTPEDRERGYMYRAQENGIEEIYPLVRLSLGLVSNEHRAFENHLQVASVAYELRKKLRSLPGSNYMPDRRRRPLPKM